MNAHSTPKTSILDALMTRLFDDEQPGDWRTGWWTGVLSVFLGLSSVLAVFAFHFPEFFTAQDLRVYYSKAFVEGWMRITIGIAFLLGVVSMLQRRRKVLGGTGVGLALLATLMGGGQVAFEMTSTSSWYLGLDWFLLNALILSLIFVPLERRFPKRGDQTTFREGWTTDVVYVFVSHAGIQALTFFSLLPATVVGEHLVYMPLREAIAAQPLLLQVIEVMILADLGQYLVHRAFHTIPWLWHFHAIHHSNRDLDWLAGSRLHLMDVLITRGLVFAPFFALGFDPLALAIWVGVVAMHGQFNHINLRFRFKGVEHVLVTPRFHHWHHATTPMDRNFSLHFPWIDRLFGTHHLPEDGAWPEETGIEGDPVPEGYIAQLIYPIQPLLNRDGQEPEQEDNNG